MSGYEMVPFIQDGYSNQGWNFSSWQLKIGELTKGGLEIFQDLSPGPKGYKLNVQLSKNCWLIKSCSGRVSIKFVATLIPIATQIPGPGPSAE